MNCCVPSEAGQHEKGVTIVAKRIPITGGPTNTISEEAAKAALTILYKGWARKHGFDAEVIVRKRTPEEMAERMAQKAAEKQAGA